MIKTEALYFTAPRKAEVREITIDPPGPGQVLVEAIVSGISAGTEMNVYRGLAPQWRKRMDPATRLFVDTDQPDWQYPARYGYASVGYVRALGADVTILREGDLVFCYAPHGRHAVVGEGQAIPLTGLKQPELGVFFANLSTALNGVLDGRPPIGAEVTVMGLGVIGQLVVRLLALAGARTIIAIDGIAGRRDLAVGGAATHALDPAGDDVAKAVHDLTNGRGADLVFEVSGAAPALNEAIRTVGYNGTVVAMSWYGGSFESLSLAGEFHHNRVKVVCSQVATVNPELGPLWTVERRSALVRDYLGTLDLAALISHRVPFDEAPEAYDLVDRRGAEAMQVLLTYGEPS